MSEEISSEEDGSEELGWEHAGCHLSIALGAKQKRGIKTSSKINEVRMFKSLLTVSLLILVDLGWEQVKSLGREKD